MSTLKAQDFPVPTLPLSTAQSHKRIPGTAHTTVIPSPKPRQLALVINGVALALDASAASPTAIFEAQAGAQLTGAVLSAVNEVDCVIGPPYSKGTRLLVNGQELPPEAAASFVHDGALPDDSRALRVPTLVANGPGYVTFELGRAEEGLAEVARLARAARADGRVR